ncbi:hypothetical protein Pla52o_31830 [Novipirellula galeiformis]|uniref:Uncharacterized protein n=1 Tax=Novipirellula galeiformis TaxID=2528004 RepID=A0A5C6CDP1_9BACT|nr:hypothetical protein Pla52o_31830 [Novipirellula galeiformis]
MGSLCRYRGKHRRDSQSGLTKTSCKQTSSFVAMPLASAAKSSFVRIANELELCLRSVGFAGSLKFDFLSRPDSSVC